VTKNPIRSLPARIVLFGFAATVATSLTVTAVSVSTMDGFLRARIDQKFPELLESTAEKLDYWYDQRLRETRIFAASEVLRSNVAARESNMPATLRRQAGRVLDRHLSDILQQFPHYSGFVVLDLANRPLNRVGERIELDAGVLEELGSIEEYRIARQTHASGGLMQIASTPISAQSGARLGTLHGLLRPGSVRDVLPAESAGPSERVYLIAAGGSRHTIGSSAEAVFGHDVPLPDNDAEATLQIYQDESGEAMIGIARHFERGDWTIVVEQPYTEVFAPVLAAIRHVVLINLLIVAGVGLAALRIAKSITRPIDVLSRAARRIYEGERGVAIPEEHSSDEMHVLARTFNEMTTRLTDNAAALEASHVQVERANERLMQQNDELQRVNEVLEQLSITDGLTKLHNHRYFQEALVHECKRTDRTQRSLALVLIDIDNFKDWNDRFGHATGDEILRRMANVMSELIRETDLLARYGGDEFALLMANCDAEGAFVMAEKIRASIAGSRFLLMPPSERQIVTVSIGVAQYSGDRRRFFNRADQALYCAKESGRDCVVSDEES
jgi:diguanylate cyclase (GGDEF)-like protein